MDGASAKSVITVRVKPSDLWCRLPREVFGNTIPQKLCIAGLRMAFSITALVTGVAAGEEKGRRHLGGDEASHFTARAMGVQPFGLSGLH